MAEVAALVFLVCCSLALAGIVRPQWVLPGNFPQTRVMACGGYILLGFLLVTVIAVIAAEPTGDGSQPTQEVAEATEPAVQMPEAQRNVIALVDEYADRYAQAENELKASRIRAERDAALREAIGNSGSISDWVGTVETMGTNGDGAAFVSIRVSDRVLLKTWNNAFSDVTAGTLIAQDHPLYDVLADLAEGQTVVFGGRVLDESSITERGSMEEPELITRFGFIMASD